MNPGSRSMLDVITKFPALSSIGSASVTSMFLMASYISLWRVSLST